MHERGHKNRDYPHRRCAPGRSRGIALIELTIALLISSVLALWASNTIQAQADDALAQATAVHLNALANAAQSYILIDYQRLADGQDVPNVANDLAPTRAELIALGRLNGGFPSFTASAQTVDISITRSSCPGTACIIIANACLSTPYQVRGRYRDDGATAVMMAMQGKGGRSHAEAPAVVRGANMNIVNPLGAQTGIVCSQSVVDAGFYASFVKINDARDPNLQGGLTVSGANATGQAIRASGELAIVDPATGNLCVQIQKDGVINVNCNGQINAATGTFIGPAGSVKVGNAGSAYTVDTGGKIRAEAGFWSALGNAFGDNTLGVRAAGTVFTVQTNDGVDALAVHDSGRAGARTSLATPVVGLTDPVVAGTACGSAAAQVTATQVTAAAATTLRALVGGGLALCDPTSGQWVASSRSATVGTACSPSGASALSSTGVMLICSNGQWATLMDRMGYLVPAESWRAVHGSVVNKPTCASGSTGSRLFAAPGNEQQDFQFVNRYFVDNGTSWTVQLTDGNQAPLNGDLLVISYCTY